MTAARADLLFRYALLLDDLRLTRRRLTIIEARIADLESQLSPEDIRAYREFHLGTKEVTP